MDLEPYEPSGDSESGYRSIVRITAEMDGHTHIYRFPPSEAYRAAQMIKLHVEEGMLHPYAGLLLLRMTREFNDG